MKSKYTFTIGERRTSKPLRVELYNKPSEIWIGFDISRDADGDVIVLAKTADGKHTSEFWIGEWINEMFLLPNNHP